MKGGIFHMSITVQQQYGVLGVLFNKQHSKFPSSRPWLLCFFVALMHTFYSFWAMGLFSSASYEWRIRRANDTERESSFMSTHDTNKTILDTVVVYLLLWSFFFFGQLQPFILRENERDIGWEYILLVWLVSGSGVVMLLMDQRWRYARVKNSLRFLAVAFWYFYGCVWLFFGRGWDGWLAEKGGGFCVLKVRKHGGVYDMMDT